VKWIRSALCAILRRIAPELDPRDSRGYSDVDMAAIRSLLEVRAMREED
jgi:hypothetical protein